MYSGDLLRRLYLVALLAEGVDRNNLSRPQDFEGHSVALLAEGVDRNLLALAVAIISDAEIPPVPISEAGHLDRPARSELHPIC